MGNKLSIIIAVIAIILIATPVGIIYLLNNGNPYTKYIANKYVPEYLEEKGYTDDQIKEAHYVEPKYGINRDFYHGHYRVVFYDEPNTSYYYGITRKGKKVNQFCEKDWLAPDNVTHTITDKTKYSEEDCVNSLDNRN